MSECQLEGCFGDKLNFTNFTNRNIRYFLIHKIDKIHKNDNSVNAWQAEMKKRTLSSIQNLTKIFENKNTP